MRNRWIATLLLFYLSCCLVCCPGCKRRGKEEQVAEWLMNSPPDWAVIHPPENLPYKSREEWISAGRKIEGIEKVLISLHQNNTNPLNPGALFRALGYVGSEDSVPLLINAVQDKNTDATDRRHAVWALGQIGNDSAVEPLCRIASSTTETRTLRCNAILALGLIGDVRAVATLEKLLVDERLEESDKRLVQTALKQLKEK